MIKPRSTVFVIDDDPHFRQAVSESLLVAGFDVEPYGSAEEFLRSFVDQPAMSQCVLVDVNLAGMSGLGLLNQLAAMKAQTPVIVITGFGNIASAVQAMRDGARDFLEKPFHRQTLLQSIHRAIDSVAQQRIAGPQHGKMRERLLVLSVREREVVRMMLGARTTKEIAAELRISPKTVAKHRAHAFGKLGIDSIVELVEQAWIID